MPSEIGCVVAADAHRRARIKLQQWTLGASASSSISMFTEMRNIGPACGEAGAPTAVLTSVTRPAAGARNESVRRRPPGAPGLLRRRSEARQFLIFGDRVAFADQQVGDPGALLVDTNLGPRDAAP